MKMTLNILSLKKDSRVTFYKYPTIFFWNLELKNNPLKYLFQNANGKPFLIKDIQET